MTAEEIRLAALRMSIIDDKVSNPDVNLILARARQYEAYIVGEASKPPRAKRTSGQADAE